MYYYEFCQGLTDRNHFYTIDEINKFKLSPKQEYYISMFAIESDVAPVNIKDKRNKFVLQRIIFDIDYKESFSKTRDIAETFYTKLLINIGLEEDNIRIYYSGKGFHFEVPNVFNITPENVKLAVKQYFPEVDNIYDTSRIIRYPGSYNTKTGLYKIPLTHDELFNADIQKLAQQPRNMKFPEYVEQYIKLDIVEEKKELKPSEPSAIVTCIQKIWNEGPIEGSRHNKMLRIASAYRRQGLTKDAVLLLLLNWAKEIPYNEIVSIVENTYKNGYAYGCNDKIMAKYCDPKCIFYRHKNFLTKVANADEMEKDFINFIMGNYERSAINFKDIFNTENFMIYPGELVAIIADTGIGKSTFLQNIVCNIDMPTLYLNLEFSQNLFYRRLIQITHNLTKEQVIHYYRNNAHSSLSEAIKHIKVISDSPDLLQYHKIITEYNPKVLCVDVIDAIPIGNYSDSVVKMEKIVNELRNLAQTMNIIIFVVHHLDKASAKEKNLTVHSGKGSTALQQKSDKVIGITRNFLSDNESERTVKSLKSRDEEPIEFNIYIDFQTFKIKKIN